MADEDFAGLRETTNKHGERLATIEQWMKSVGEQLTTFVTKSEFGPVKMIAYGLAITVMGSVVTAVVAKVIVK